MLIDPYAVANLGREKRPVGSRTTDKYKERVRERIEDINTAYDDKVSALNDSNNNNNNMLIIISVLSLLILIMMMRWKNDENFEKNNRQNYFF